MDFDDTKAYAAIEKLMIKERLDELETLSRQPFSRVKEGDDPRLYYQTGEYLQKRLNLLRNKHLLLLKADLSKNKEKS